MPKYFGQRLALPLAAQPPFAGGAGIAEHDLGHRMHLVTPGIRPAGAGMGDQKRIMTPARAIAAGADYLVVGRPVLEASDPKAAADAIVAEIAQTPHH